MNLWVNRLGQLAMLAVALFFFACEDETSLLGFKNPNSKFDVRYLEIDIESRQLLDTTLRTSNLYYPGELNRFLVGQYEDPIFGTIKSTAYTQFLAANFVKLPAGAELDSATIKLVFDYYLYGNTSIDHNAGQTIAIHELTDSLNERGKHNYHFGTSNVSYNPEKLGSRVATMSRKLFNGYKDSTNSRAISINLGKDGFAQRLFDDAILFRDKLGKPDATKDDTAFFYFPDRFMKKFPGLAIVHEPSAEPGTNMMFGLNANSSSLILHYHVGTQGTTGYKEDQRIYFSFLEQDFQMSYNRITADRGESELATLQPRVLADLDKRYIQSGLGLVPQIDLTDALEFADTIPNILIQSATLSIEAVESSYLDPPAGLCLRALNVENYVEKYRGSSQDTKDVNLYSGQLYPDFTLGSVLVDYDSAYFVRNDNGSGALLVYDSEKKKYTGSIGGFLQQALKKTPGRTPYVRFAVYPVSPLPTKSVNRVVFDKDKIKLRVYYVKPTVNTD